MYDHDAGEQDRRGGRGREEAIINFQKFTLVQNIEECVSCLTREQCWDDVRKDSDDFDASIHVCDDACADGAKEVVKCRVSVSPSRTCLVTGTQPQQRTSFRMTFITGHNQATQYGDRKISPSYSLSISRLLSLSLSVSSFFLYHCLPLSFPFSSPISLAYFSISLSFSLPPLLLSTLPLSSPFSPPHFLAYVSLAPFLSLTLTPFFVSLFSLYSAPPPPA